MTRFSSMVDRLRLHADAEPTRPAVAFLRDEEGDAAELTYGALDLAARTLAASLGERGLARRPALLLYPPGIDFVVAFFGCLYAGAIPVPLYPPRGSRGLPRVRSVARDVGATAALTSRDVLAWLAPRLARDGTPIDVELVTTDDVAALDGAADGWRPPAIDEDSVALVQYTSGSTSDPKGVVVSHANLMANERAIQTAFGQSSESVVVGWLPLFHDMGLIGNVLQTIYSGARCVLMSPAAFLQQPVRWLRTIERYRATTSGGPNFAYDLCARRISADQREGLDLRSWRVAFNGSEPIRADTIDRFCDVFAGNGFRRGAFVPCYGLAEATLLVASASSDEPVVVDVDSSALSAHRVVAASPNAASRRLVSSGAAPFGHDVVTVDPTSGRRCEPGEVGEVWVQGPSVAERYWAKPEESDLTFRARLDDGSGPYLRTGDLGFLDGSELFVTGRRKDVVIVRGANIYPHDVERTAEESHPALARGGCAAFAVEVSGEERLAIVQEIAGRRVDDADAVTAAVLGAVTAAHDVRPCSIILTRAGGVPKTSSGKVRRSACRDAFLADELPAVARWDDPSLESRPATSATHAGVDDASVAARVAAIVATALGCEAGLSDPTTPLVSLGLDSLVAMELAHAIERELGAYVPVEELLGGATIGSLVARVEACDRRPAASGSAPPTGPLSVGQQALAFLHALAPESDAYNVAGGVRLRGRLDVAALDASVAAVVARHDALRTRFSIFDDEPSTTVEPAPETALATVDGSAWSVTELDDWIAAFVRRPFELESAPPVRFGLVRRSSDDHAFVAVLHGIVCDLRSLEIVFEEIWSSYDALRRGALVDARIPATPYADFVAWQREMLADERGFELADRAATRFARNEPRLVLPSGVRRERRGRADGGSTRFRVDRIAATALTRLASDERVAPASVLLAAWQVLLGRYSGQRAFAVALPLPGRVHPQFAGTVGCFANTAPVAASLAPGASFRDVVRRAHDAVLEVAEVQDYPYALAARGRRRGETELTTAFVFHGDRTSSGGSAAAIALGDRSVFAVGEGLTAEGLVMPELDPQFELALHAVHTPDALWGVLRYDASRHDVHAVERMARNLAVLIEDAVARPEARWDDLRMLDGAEARQVSVEWPATAAAPETGDSPREPNAPRTPIERELCEIWSEVLGAPEVGVDDDFFDLGGTSLVVMRMLRSVRRAFDVSVPVAAFLSTPTVEELAVHVLAAQVGAGTPDELARLLAALDDLPTDGTETQGSNPSARDERARPTE